MTKAALLLAVTASVALAQSDVVRVTSPGGQIEFRLLLARPTPQSLFVRLAYQVFSRGKPLLDTSFLGLEIQNQQPILGENIGLVSSKMGSFDETYTVRGGKSKVVRNHYNSLFAEYLQNGSLGRRLNLEVRAYDDGVAFRYLIPKTTALDEFRLESEDTEFQFARDVSGIHQESLIALPFLVEQPSAGWVVITEAHIENYSGMHLKHTEGRIMITTLAPRVDEKELVVKGATPLNSPWRVLMIGSDRRRILESNLVMNLNPPSAIADTSWIKPGKAPWNASLGARPETAAIEHDIDLAAESKLEDVLIAAGWSAPGDITKTIPAIDLPRILAHAKSKAVRLWLSAHWTSIDRQRDQAFPLFEKWGVAGVRIDLMNRDDQWMVDFWRRAAKKAAEHHLMIDFQGAYKSDGISRTYPNVIAR